MKRDSQHRTLRYLGWAVVFLWLAVLGYYLWTQAPAFSPSGPVPAAAAGLEREEWMGLYQNDRKIGYNHSVMQRQDGQYLLQDEMVLRVKLMGESQETRVKLEGRLAPDFSLQSFRLEAFSDFMDLRAEGQFQGHRLKLSVWTAGQELQQEIPLSGRPVLYTTAAFAERLKQAGLETGRRISLPVFEPLTRQSLPVTLVVESEEEVEALGRTQMAFKVRENFQGQEQFFWITAEGEVLKEWHASGLSALRESEYDALHRGWDAAGAVDLIAALMVRSNTAILNPREVSYFKARLKGISLEGLDLNSDRQKIQGDTVEVTREEELFRRGYELPWRGAEPELTVYLQADAAVQSEHPEIVRAAREAIGPAREAVEAARRLNRWVAETVTDSMVMSIPSALEVLKQKRGACKEHAVLYTALARAAGIPARMVSGVVYSEAQLIEGFYYHAWVEVYLAGPGGERGRWVAVDPTFNQFPADATHVRLVEGGLDQMLNLLGVVGRLEVEVERWE